MDLPIEPEPAKDRRDRGGRAARPARPARSARGGRAGQTGQGGGIAAATTIEEVLRRRPRAARVFQRHRMACVGCAMAPFDTVAEAAAVYGLPLGALLAELERSSPPRARAADQRKDAKP